MGYGNLGDSDGWAGGPSAPVAGATGSLARDVLHEADDSRSVGASCQAPAVAAAATAAAAASAAEAL